MTERLWKVLSADGTPCHGGSGQWNLPKGKRPGKWMPKIKGELALCKNGYHLCRDADLVYWLDEKIHPAEYRGNRLEGSNKIAVQQARILPALTTWNERTQRLFACDCAERTLLGIENLGERSVECIRISRLYANGKATKEELSAAESAAWSAAWSAVWNVARRNAARSATWSAAESAASAARSAADSAAWDVERSCQTKQLFEYLELDYEEKK